MYLILFVTQYKGQTEKLNVQLLCSDHRLCTSWCGQMNFCKPWLRCLAIYCRSWGIEAKPLGISQVMPRSPTLSSWFWLRGHIHHCVISYRCFYKCFSAGLKYWHFFLSLLLLFTLSQEVCFSWEKVKMSTSNLRCLSSRQTISILSAGTERSVSNHLWQHIKLHFYLRSEMVSPLGHSLSLEMKVLFSTWKPSTCKTGEWLNHWGMNLTRFRERGIWIFRIYQQRNS